MFVCFMDASKAFDRINHSLLIRKLFNRNIPFYLIRLIHVWYNSQSICVKWGAALSNFFTVSNGIRQGSILSPLLFNLYFDTLSLDLNQLDVGCYFNYITTNHLMYADDVILVCPSTHGLQKLIDTCGKFGIEHDVIFNDKKTVCMAFKTGKYKNFDFPNFRLNNCDLQFVSQYKYLGHVITDDLCDDEDIHRQLSHLYARGNTLVRLFNRCSNSVKSVLFNTHITNIYCSHLWSSYKVSSFNVFRVAYNNIFRSLFNVPRHIEGITVSVSEAQSANRIATANVAIGRVGKSLLTRLNTSDNRIVSRFVETQLYQCSPLVDKFG